MKMYGEWNYQGMSDNDYLYNGKELNKELGLGLYDYGARFYDPVVGRFPSTDRFSEKFSFQTPYAYAAGNPINFIDVNGDSIFIKHKGEIIKYDNGKVTDAKTGKAYTGKFVNKKGKLKGFFKRTVKALNKIRNGGVNGQKLIESLNHNEIISIERGDNVNNGLMVSWHPNNVDGGADGMRYSDLSKASK